MRYTRYEYKKSSKVKFLFSVLIIVGISIVGGLYVSNFIFQGKSFTNNSTDNSKSSTVIGDEKNIKNIIAIQCGFYSKEENAKEALISLSKYCQPVIIEDNGNYRVIAGIYDEEEGIKKIEEFKSNNIEVSKVDLNISADTLENKKITEIIDGYLSILKKLEDNQVKSIKTSEFKEWANNLINDGNYVKNNRINELSNYVNELPDEIDKKNSTINLQKMYNIIKN